MKKNFVIGVLVFISMMVFVFAYTKNLETKMYLSDLVECQESAIQLQMLAERAAELAKRAEQNALIQVELAQEKRQQALKSVIQLQMQAERVAELANRAEQNALIQVELAQEKLQQALKNQ